MRDEGKPRDMKENPKRDEGKPGEIEGMKLGEMRLLE